MTTTILLIRHGETDWNVARRWQGRTDVPLNQTGIAQARALGERLASWPVRALYSSDLQRAAMTADILGRSLSLAPVYNPGWRERDVGAFEGLTNEEIQVKFPEAWGQMQAGLLNPPGGEDHLAFRARAAKAYEEVVAQHNGEMVAAVSHGGLLYGVICHVLQIPPHKFGRITLRGNTGLSIVEVGRRGPILTMLNDTRHLDGNGL